VKTVYCY